MSPSPGEHPALPLQCLCTGASLLLWTTLHGQAVLTNEAFRLDVTCQQTFAPVAACSAGTATCLSRYCHPSLVCAHGQHVLQQPVSCLAVQ